MHSIGIPSASMTRTVTVCGPTSSSRQLARGHGRTGGQPRLPRPSRRSGVSVRAELGGNYDETFSDISKHLTDLFNYKAVRTVLNQLTETDPTTYRWLYNFASEHPPHRQEEFCKELLKVNRELGERILATRVDLFERWTAKAKMGGVLEDMKKANLTLMRESLFRTTNLEVLQPHPILDAGLVEGGDESKNTPPPAAGLA